MNETKCDECPGLACGDECDGKSHATTERTCDTCDHDNKPTCDPGKCLRGPGMWKPRPAAQDADELRYAGIIKIFENIREELFERSTDMGSYRDGYEEGIEEAIRLMFDKMRRPSRPMSAEVEKAIETATKYTQSYIDWWSTVECQCEPESDAVCDKCAHVKNGHAILSAISTIVAALKARG